MTNYNGKEVLNGLLFIKSMMSVENVERQAIALRKLATPIPHLIFHFIFINFSLISVELSKQVLWQKKKPHKWLVYAIYEALFTIQTRQVWFDSGCSNSVIYTILH